MLTLYDAARCPFCARVRIALAEKDVPYETIAIDLSDRPAWLYEKNPSGKVPVLEEDGWLLAESAVIDEYLDERYPEPPLLPDDPAERAFARLLIFRFDEYLGDPYYALRRGEPDAEKGLAAALSRLDTLLGELPYLTGRAFGLADVAYLPWVLRARDMLDVPLSPHPAVEDWARRLTERQSIAAEVLVVAAL
jgi:RNA polymerase-associated protein